MSRFNAKLYFLSQVVTFMPLPFLNDITDDRRFQSAEHFPGLAGHQLGWEAPIATRHGSGGASSRNHLHFQTWIEVTTST